MSKRQVFVFFALACILIPQFPAAYAQAQKPTGAAAQRDDPVEPIVKRATTELELRPEQSSAYREILSRHWSKISDLRNKLQAHPYYPQLSADAETEQKAILAELTALLDDEQKKKAATFEARAIPPPPGFIVISLPARQSADGPFNAEAFIPAPQPKAKSARLTDDQRVLQVLNRITFGPRPGDIQTVKQMGIDAYINQQLHPEAIDDSDLVRRLDVLPTTHFTSAELYQYYPEANAAMKRAGDKNAPPVYGRPRQVLMELMQERLVRAAESKRQLQEVMTDFWFNHFNVFSDKLPGPYFLATYDRDVIRPNSVGKFRDLLLAVAQSPAMLFYLDNWLSQTVDARRPNQPSAQPSGPPKPKAAQPAATPKPAANTAAASDNASKAEPGRSDGQKSADAKNVQGDQKAAPAKAAAPKPGINENYARELMELHTLGVDGGYTQKDVQEVARCFTGWTLDHGYQGDATFVFRPWMHDPGSKTVLGTVIPAGGGYQDGLRVIDILSHHPSTARFISKELCERFVADNPPQQLVDRVAQVFLRTDGDIREVLKAILTSPEFNSPASFRSKIKSPLELAASALRALDGDTDGGPPIEGWVSRSGEPLYRYQFPTGYGEDSSRWVNSGVFLTRINFMVDLANNRVKGTSYVPERFVLNTGEAAGKGEATVKDPSALADRLAALIVHTNLSPESRKALLLAISHPPERQDTKVAASSAGGPATGPQKAIPAMVSSDSSSRPITTRPNVAPARLDPNPAARVSQIIELLLGTAEFQRR
jgi:uncharacterized protein (DUF1800 family)